MGPPIGLCGAGGSRCPGVIRAGGPPEGDDLDLLQTWPTRPGLRPDAGRDADIHHDAGLVDRDVPARCGLQARRRETISTSCKPGRLAPGCARMPAGTPTSTAMRTGGSRCPGVIRAGGPPEGDDLDLLQTWPTRPGLRPDAGRDADIHHDAGLVDRDVPARCGLEARRRETISASCKPGRLAPGCARMPAGTPTSTTMRTGGSRRPGAMRAAGPPEGDDLGFSQTRPARPGLRPGCRRGRRHPPRCGLEAQPSIGPRSPTPAAMAWLLSSANNPCGPVHHHGVQSTKANRQDHHRVLRQPDSGGCKPISPLSIARSANGDQRSPPANPPAESASDSPSTDQSGFPAVVQPEGTRSREDGPA